MKEIKSASVCLKVYKQKKEKLEAKAKDAGLHLGPFVESQLDKVESLEQQVEQLETQVKELTDRLAFYENDKAKETFKRRHGQTAFLYNEDGIITPFVINTLQDVATYNELGNISFNYLMRRSGKGIVAHASELPEHWKISLKNIEPWRKSA